MCSAVQGNQKRHVDVLLRDFFGQARDAVSGLSVQATLVSERAGGLQQVKDFFLTFFNAGKAWLEWNTETAFDRSGDIDSHAATLTTATATRLQAGDSNFKSNSRNQSGVHPLKSVWLLCYRTMHRAFQQSMLNLALGSRSARLLQPLKLQGI